MVRARHLLALSLLTGVFGCATTATQPVATAAPAPASTPSAAATPATEAPSTTPAPASAAESVAAVMDSSVDPCNDFYQYACGSWLAATKLPADQSRWARSFSVIHEENQEVVRSILEQAAAEPAAKDADWTRMGTFYGSCMDEDAIETAGAAPLAPMLEEIDQVSGVPSAMRVAAELQAHGASPFFDIETEPDFKDPDLMIAFFSQGGLGLPDRDYYVKDDAESRKLLADYQAHVAKMLELLGEDSKAAADAAARVVSLETRLAKMSRTRTEMRDMEKIYHRVDLTGLKKLAPDVPWNAFLDTMGAPNVKDISVTVPEFFQGLDTLLGETDAATLRDYLRWHLVDSSANLLPKAFVNEHFAFFGRRLSGQKEQQPRWKRCVDGTDRGLGEIVGRYFVEKRFPGESKATARELINDVEGAFAADLDSLGWMDAETRERALEKLHAVTNKVGYPDHWRDYSALTLEPGDYYGNAIAVREFEVHRQLAKVGGPVDRSEWHMTPAMVNAYYNPLANEMVFPAGILQAPFFSKDYPMAMNFGGIGMVMGHELTHGFDDQGRKFNDKGQLVQWWNPDVVQRFTERTKCLVNLYDSYEVEPGVHLKGALTLGENIADFGGIKLAHMAFEKWLTAHPEAATGLDGLTPDQLFFVAFAQTWCTKSTPEIKKMLATVDPHSASRFRVNGPLSNLPAFAQAFSCAPGTPMHREDACSVW